MATFTTRRLSSRRTGIYRDGVFWTEVAPSKVQAWLLENAEAQTLFEGEEARKLRSLAVASQERRDARDRLFGVQGGFDF